ncbi:MAG: metal ABC transporter substrate-binding protein, partial [Bacteriovoracaceae bacterium]|nr:metal ABC transporter substrate-binding protein [Bacteriovoracaceae bacterium]
RQALQKYRQHHRWAAVMLSLIAAVMMPQMNMLGNGLASAAVTQTPTVLPSAAPVMLVDTYALGIAALNLTAQTPWQVHPLVPLTGGCPHHYQLKAQDWAKLSDAQMVVANGLGLDAFLPAIKKRFPNLPILELEQNLDLLPAAIPLGGEEKHQVKHDLDHHHDHETDHNAHVWMAVDNLMAQVRQFQTALENWAATRQGRTTVQKNGKNYLRELKKLQAEIHLWRKQHAVKGKALVLSDGFAYLVRDLGWQPVLWGKEEDSGISPKELVEVLELIKRENINDIFAEDGQSNMATTLAQATAAQIVYWTPVLQGPWEKDGYLKLMRQNLAAVSKVVKR